MQKLEPIDELFRQGLTDYSLPPAKERRTAFLRAAAGRPKKGPGYLWWLIGAVVLILTVAGTALYLSQDPSKPITANVSKASDSRPLTLAPVQHVSPATTPSASSEKSSRVTNCSSKQLSSVMSSPARSSPARAVQPQSPAPGGRTTASGPSGTNPSPAKAVQPQSPAPGGTTASAPSSPVSSPANAVQPQSPVPGGTTAKPAPTMPLNENTQASEPIQSPSSDADNVNKSKTNPDTLIIPGHQSVPSRDRGNNSLPKKWNISLDASYTPEWMFNTLNGDKFANNMGVEGTFHFGKYSVRTGAGISITTGSNEMLVQSNPYLGNYNALDSITFAWDHYVLVPTYYTKSTNVYDTIYNYTYSNNKKRYTYLQIPLVLGYDFWENNWLSLGIRAGAVMSVLLKSESLSETYDPGKDRIVTINNISPDRIQMNWQAVGGINAAFRMSRRLSIELEPQVRYYFNSVYESSELTKKPWSVGIRTAFVITF